MTANVNPKPINISDGLVVRNVKWNNLGLREQLSLQTTLEGGRHDDASISLEEDCSRRYANNFLFIGLWSGSETENERQPKPVSVCTML